MPRSETDTEELAREVAERVEQDLAMGEQLSLLPEPDLPAVAQGDEARSVGRPKGAKNKGSSQLREWLSARGLRMPEEIMAEMAGLHRSHGDAFNFAMAQAERLLAHVSATAENRVYTPDKGHVVLDTPWKASPSDFMDTFKFFYSMARQSANDLMPYGTSKAGTDGPAAPVVNVIMPQPPAQQGGHAVDVTPNRPKPTARTGRLMPADMREDVEQNQQLSDGPAEVSDGENRTGEASD